MPTKLSAGFGRTDVTPQLGIRLGGYGIEVRPAEIINDPLHATTLVLQQDNLKVAIISLDWLCVEEEDCETIRQCVKAAVGIPAENITVCATHTHTAANTISASGWGNKERKYIAEAIPNIVDSVHHADKALTPVSVGVATTESKVGVSRRGIMENNQTGFLADPSEPYDSTMTVIRFDGLKGPVGTLVHYGAHGTCIGHGRIISRDWPGVMADRVEEQTHAPVLFINGSLGDTGPRTSMIYKEGIGFSAGIGDGLIAATEVGLRAATDALEAWLSIKEFRDKLMLKTITKQMSFPYAPLPSLDKAEREQLRCESEKDVWGSPMCEHQYWKRVTQAHANTPLEFENYTQTITLLGPIAIVPIPGEPFSGISRRLRRLSPMQYTLCAGVSNGCNGYFVSREARHRGGYEPWASRALKTYLYADNIDDVLVENNLKLLRELASGTHKL